MCNYKLPKRPTLAALLLGALTVPTGHPAAQTTVYRCTDPNGSVEFRQRPCATSAAEATLSIEDRPTGWTPPKAYPAPRASGTPRRPPSRARREAKADTRQAERCWQKRRQLEEVNAQLRRGYKPARGEKLRRRRSAYEDYVDRFCREN